MNADIASNAAIVMSKIAQPSSVQNFQLTTTTGTTIASVPISTAGNYQVNAYARVATTGTTLTLQTSWTDSAGAQSFSWFNQQFEQVGSYVLPQVFFNAVAGATLTVTGKTFAANNIFVSSSIVGPL